VNMGGLSQINCLKQFVQFGMDKEMALGGALFELESMLSVPPQALTGWWDYEWWWNQPGVASAAAFNAAIIKATGRPAATARHWFGWVSVHSFAIAAEKAKSVEAVKLAKALEGEELPDEVKCQPGKCYYRQGDHQLMADIFVGQPHPAKGANPADLVEVKAVVPGDKAALPVTETGCHMTWPTA